MAGLSHGFLMVQIEVSLLPLRAWEEAGRQAEKSARTALPPVKPAAGLGLVGGGRAPSRGTGDAWRLHRGQAHVWAQ